MISWILILVGGLWLAVILAKNYGIPLIQKLRPGTVPASVVSTVDKVDDYADMVAGIAACFAITAIAKKRGNTALAAQVADVRVSLAKLADDSITPAA